MRICLASWAPIHAGAEVAVERLAVGLREDGHDVSVILGTRDETFERMRNAALDVQYVPLAFTDKLHWWRYLRAQRELRRVLQEVQPDIMHANDLPTSQMVGEMARQLAIPTICHHRWIFAGSAIDWLNKFGAEQHLFVSQALMEALCASSAQLAASRNAVVYDGLPLPVTPSEADRTTARSKLRLPGDTAIVLFAGQIIERKGVADLLRAWQHVATTWPSPAELILVGDDLESAGQYRREMEELAGQLPCAPRFVGFQRNVADWITAADFCVVPSHVEPLGNATLEAMAHARPVIGTRVGGIPEMVSDVETGLLVPPHDPPALAAAIERLLRDSVLRASLGQAARKRCEASFSLRAHVDAIVGHYRNVLNCRDALTA
jgi:glycosyltransferase involved in cell wall biosynthesis